MKDLTRFIVNGMDDVADCSLNPLIMLEKMYVYYATGQIKTHNLNTAKTRAKSISWSKQSNFALAIFNNCLMKPMYFFLKL